jgi:hypothetical protein
MDGRGAGPDWRVYLTLLAALTLALYVAWSSCTLASICAIRFVVQVPSPRCVFLAAGLADLAANPARSRSPASWA